MKDCENFVSLDANGFERDEWMLNGNLSNLSNGKCVPRETIEVFVFFRGSIYKYNFAFQNLIYRFRIFFILKILR